MPCSLLPRMLRTNPRKPWLMLPVLLMNSELNRITPHPWLDLRMPSTTNWEIWRLDLLMLRLLPPREVKLPWPKLRLRSENLRPNWPTFRLTLVRLLRHTRGPRGR